MCTAVTCRPTTNDMCMLATLWGHSTEIKTIGKYMVRTGYEQWGDEGNGRKETYAKHTYKSFTFVSFKILGFLLSRLRFVV